tara:strand:+ start:147 stop:923 length:777 start_codon:yes stop_codon:yes gene_type:complete
MLTDTLFPIKEIPVTYDVAGWDEPQPAGYKLITREDNNKILSCMTNDYKVVTNKEIIDTAVPILKQHKAELQESISLGNGERTIWKWIIPHIKIEVAKGDVLNPEIIIKNSYDGSLQVHVLAGAFRLVCSNGLIIGVTLGQSNFKHNVNNKNLEKLDAAIENTISHSLEVGDEFEMLANTLLNEKDIMKLVKLFPSQMSEYLVQYLIANKPKDYWGLLNTATYLATHKMNRYYKSTHRLEQEIFPNVKKWAAKAAAQA